MLWNKRKTTDPMRGSISEAKASSPEVQAAPASRSSASQADTGASSHRVAEADRALTTIGTLLKLYGRHAFDTEHTASTIRERCDEWAQRIVLGVFQRADAAPAKSSASSQNVGAARDWRGLERFFEEQRQREGTFVKSSLNGLRGTVLELARSLGGSIGEDRESDAMIEERLTGLSKAIDQGDMASITRAASSVIEASRESMAQRREREARHAHKLDKELRSLRESVADDGKGSDELTGLYGRGPYEQQLDQLTAIGMLLEQPPWLIVVDVSAGKRDPNKPEKRDAKKQRPVPDRTLREVSHCISRTFLRRQDFAARTAQDELCVLLVDMTRDQVAAAVERLLETVYTKSRDLPNSDVPVLNIGVVRLRANEDGARWRSRADVGVERAREDGSDTYTIDGQKPR